MVQVYCSGQPQLYNCSKQGLVLEVWPLVVRSVQTAVPQLAEPLHHIPLEFSPYKECFKLHSNSTKKLNVVLLHSYMDTELEVLLVRNTFPDCGAKILQVPVQSLLSK